MKTKLFTIYDSRFTTVDVEHDGDDDEEKCFELEEVLPVEAACVVARYGVEEEGASGEADRQPDDLSLPVPHGLMLRAKCPRRRRARRGLPRGIWQPRAAASPD